LGIASIACCNSGRLEWLEKQLLFGTHNPISAKPIFIEFFGQQF
jgi:hypothetical protein